MDITNEAKNTGDASAKRILKYRIVLANIIKYAIPKYSCLGADEIMALIPISPKTPDGLYVREDNSEDKEDKKHIDFDLLFPVKEQGMEKVSIWCDIEPQNKYMIRSENDDQSYDLAARGIYYLSRMISRQLSSGGENSGYRHLHKCYGIWICFDHIDDQSWIPTVTRHKISPVKLTEEDSNPPKHETDAADLMELIIIRAGGSPAENKSLIGLVNSLWRDVTKLPEYIPEDYDGFNIIRKETTNMCDMREVGAEWGKAEGIAEERVRSRIEFVQSLLDLKFPFAKALETAKIDEETYNTYKDKYGKDNLS